MSMSYCSGEHAIGGRSKHRLTGALVLLISLVFALSCGPDQTTSTPGDLECEDDQTECSGICVDTDSSAQHCGECDNACGDGEVCGEGECRLYCPGDQTACDGACYDLDADPNNCGECGNECTPGQVCVGGECATECGAGFALCDGMCRDIDADPEHCGDCSNACEEGEVCSGGSCELSCGVGLEECDGACHDLDADPNNCGECGNSCDDGQVCSAGGCATECGAGLGECDGTCRDLDVDPNNCGECGNSCDDGEVCSDGNCEPSCGAGLDECDGICRDLDNHPANCGDCGVSCADDEVCVAGSCQVSCPGDQQVCAGMCFDTDSAVDHCGECGNACGDGELCVDGSCEVVCPPGQQLCGDDCVDTDSSPDHCGGCGNTCGDNEVCSDGGCESSCGAGLTECSGACVDLSSDPDHCGACDDSCDGADNAAAVCVDENCQISCLADYNNCDGDAATGCETIGSCAERYSREVTVDNPGSELDDFQVRVEFDTQNAIADGTMNPDCSDIRFYDDDEITELDYWLEDGCDSNQTTVWIRIPTLPADGDHTVHLRYGDDQADSASDGHAVFEHFDDFSADTEDDYTLHSHDDWSGGEFHWITDDEVLRSDTSNNHFYLTHDDTEDYGDDFWVETRTFSRDDDGMGPTIWRPDEQFYTCTVTNDYPRDPSDTEKLHYSPEIPSSNHEGENLLDFGDIKNPENNWVTVGTAFDGSHIHCAYDYDVQAQTYNLGAIDIDGLGLGSFANDPAADYDWWRVRKYTADEPTVSVGDEQLRY